MQKLLRKPKRQIFGWHRCVSSMSIVVFALALVCGSIQSAAAQTDNVDERAEAIKAINDAPWRGEADDHMIAVEALIVEVNEDKTRDLQLNYGYTRNDVSKVIEGADILLGPSFSRVSVPTFDGDSVSGETSVGFKPRLPGLGASLQGMDVAGGVFSARMRALLDQGHARITTRPIAMALNGKEAYINVTMEVPYQDIDLSKRNPIIAFEKIGVQIKITPTILDLSTRIVHLGVDEVRVSNISNFVTEQNVDRPVFNESYTRSEMTMKSGETYVMSSLKSQRTQTIRQGIPILMHIPILGHFFSGREEIGETVDVLFFLTPYIVEPGENILLPYDFLHGQDLIEQGFNPDSQRDR